MKKIGKFLLILLGVLLLVVIAFLAYYSIRTNQLKRFDTITLEEVKKEYDLNREKSAPENGLFETKVLGKYNGRTIKEIYYCSDVCPVYGGYYIVYEGVSELECPLLGGAPSYGYGWGKRYLGCGVIKGEE